ncbi:MAG: hypothetical protein QW650_00290 [Thermofilum sp.]
MRVSRPSLDLAPFSMLAEDLFFLVRSVKNVSPSNAPVRCFLPYHFSKPQETQDGLVFELDEGASFERFFLVLEDGIVPFDEGWALQENTLFLPSVPSVRGGLFVGYSFVNPRLLEAGKRLPFWRRYETLWKKDPVELAFRVRDTYHAISQLPKEKAYLSLITIFLGLPYAKASGTLVRQELYENNTVRLLIDTGEVIFEQLEHPTPKVLEHWVVEKGMRLERGQPLTNLVRLKSQGCTLQVEVDVG